MKKIYLIVYLVFIKNCLILSNKEEKKNIEKSEYEAITSHDINVNEKKIECSSNNDCNRMFICKDNK